MKRRNLFISKLKEKDRIALLRFCLSMGDHAKISTMTLMRPLDLELLEKAFVEKEKDHQEVIDTHLYRLENFEELAASQGLLDCFQKRPTKAEYAQHVEHVIEMEKDGMKRIRQSYHVYVDTADITKEELEFHQSLNPRVTFGYSNYLHEECSFALTPLIRDFFLSLAAQMQGTQESSYESFYFQKGSLQYEDLKVLKDGETMLSCLSHEQMFEILLTEEELKLLRDFEGQRKRNAALIKKLCD